MPKTIRNNFQDPAKIYVDSAKLHDVMHKMCKKIQRKSDPENVYSEFRELIIEKSELFFPPLKFRLRGVLTIMLCNILQPDIFVKLMSIQ